MILLDSTLINLQSLEQLQDHALRQQRLPYLLPSTECWQLCRGPPRWRCGEGEESRDGKSKLIYRYSLSIILKGDLWCVGHDRWRSLTGLLGRVFHEERGDVFIHPHLVFGDAGVGSSVLVPDAADQQLRAVCYKVMGLASIQGADSAIPLLLPANGLHHPQIHTRDAGAMFLIVVRADVGHVEVMDGAAGSDLWWGVKPLMHSCSDCSCPDLIEHNPRVMGWYKSYIRSKNFLLRWLLNVCKPHLQEAGLVITARRATNSCRLVCKWTKRWRSWRKAFHISEMSLALWLEFPFIGGRKVFEVKAASEQTFAEWCGVPSCSWFMISLWSVLAQIHKTSF